MAKAEGATLALGATTAEGGRRDAGTGSNNGGRRKARRWHWEQQRRKAEGAMLALGATTADGGRRDAGTGSNNGGRRKAEGAMLALGATTADGGRRDAGTGSNNGGRQSMRPSELQGRGANPSCLNFTLACVARRCIHDSSWASWPGRVSPDDETTAADPPEAVCVVEAINPHWPVGAAAMGGSSASNKHTQTTDAGSCDSPPTAQQRQPHRRLSSQRLS
ncbi:hypothetical protein PMIN01_09452 [Paraphaeosphaeria minitans]|uniref:Uncharacterized protein n=1 Tax=Paraphaeosphaeria minitans TaxID=565426 RepID=A0A9P6KNI3_9PLEO|nr:hypothetical protein PMIN01_09452 [Paraphaeosphaeria minitans]